MQELVYCDYEVRGIIVKKFPDMIITDASDYVHEDRFEVKSDTVTEDEFYPFAIDEGFALCCFGFQLMTMQKEHHDKLDRWVSLSSLRIERKT